MTADRREEYDSGRQSEGAAVWAWVIFACLEFLLAVQAVLAYRERFLTVSQMQQRGIEHGLPFIWHLGMWGDALIIPPLAAYIVRRHSPRWRARSMSISAVVAIALSCLMSWTFTLGNVPEAHVLNHQLTAVGAVHFAYMVIALAVFFEFFVFTDNLLPREIATVGLLLVLHLFSGTHMVLGLVNTVSPLSWYSGTPLRSKVGWAVLVSVAAIVIVRSLWLIEAFRRRVHHAVDIFMYVIVQDWKPLHGFFNFFDWVCTWLGAGYFLKTIYSRFNDSVDFQNGAWSGFITNQGLQLILIATFGLKYFFSRQSAKRELAIALTVFPRYSIPNDWSRGSRLVAASTIVGFLGLYWALGRYVDNVKIVTGIMFLVACGDWRGRYLINANIKRYFADEKYAPLPEDPEREIIWQRRRIVDHHLFNLPYLKKEAACAGSCGVAFLLALVSDDSTWLRGAAYIVLIGTLVVNEVITQRWRWGRHKQLRAVPQLVSGTG